ncbi:MAG: zinc ribbon domain-containing protein [Synergistaceae bacterium]|jgi:ribosomal protein L40E|nr:zinc ribbon domain-containing protein [Synergistaceae bacterium]
MNDPSEINLPQSADIEKLRENIKSLTSDAAALKGRIGEYFWQAFLEDGQYEPELGGVFREIQMKTDEITSLEQEIQILEDGAGQPMQPPVQFQLNNVICRSCGMLNDGEAKFCQACGIAIREEIVSEYKVEDYGKCPLCGATLPEDAVFCYTCGARIRM